MYQDTAPATITTLLEPNTTIPAQLAPYVPPPQPTIIPAASPAVPGVIIGVDGTPYYGHPPIIYAQPQMLADPQAAQMVGRGAMLAGGGILAAGVGVGAAELVSAVAAAGVGAGTLLAAAALMAIGKAKAPKRIVNHINRREEYHQHVTNTATGWLGRATGSINSASNHTTSSTIS
ncbi:hypothetical protein OG455_41310 [Kitasatospora sp. NBC_01287]|uniref:hypothetical protein n=1 Tax=Kitasatospora sp. NBC_01287 TaxID=2903573 RepID=UPI0022589EDF|nr:hypothetical protein [Kitasatospora sp. NBC_01287]MCX4750922.1 hypothetical protein [Kitasatospora sp. NBC_01287]MCX4751827.1 hypothetical protein [Kitasatospora sp. NBC_01287]MCX4751881.1 hypothetical protein [Kitasatospora sp. NBC_01287]